MLTGRDGREGRRGLAGPQGLPGPKGIATTSLQRRLRSNIVFHKVKFSSEDKDGSRLNDCSKNKQLPEKRSFECIC